MQVNLFYKESKSKVNLFYKESKSKEKEKNIFFIFFFVGEGGVRKGPNLKKNYF